MRKRADRWDPRPPNVAERIVAGVWLTAFVPVQASALAGWRLLGDYDKPAAAVLLMVGLLLLFRVFPGLKRT